MRTCLISTILLLVAFHLQAQNSIEKILENNKARLAKLKGVSKIDCLNAICDGYFKLGFFGPGDKRVDSIALYAEQARVAAINHRYRLGEAQSLVHLGFIEKCKFNNKKAEELIKAGLETKAADLQLQAKAAGLLGAIFFEGYKKSDIAANYFKESLRLYKLAGDITGESLILTRLCLLYSTTKNYDECVDFCTRSMTQAKKIRSANINEPWINYQVLQSAALIINLYKQAGDFQTALNYQRQAAAYARAQNMDKDIDMDIGSLYYLDRKYDSALYYLNRFHRNNPAILWGKHYLGRTYFELKDYDKAEPLFIQCIDSFNKRNKGRNDALFSMYAGKLYLEKKNYDKAIYFARQTLAGRQHDDHQFSLNKYDFLSRAYYHSGFLDSAYYFMQKFAAQKDSGLGTEPLFKLNNYKREAEDARKAMELAQLGRDIAIKAWELKEQQLIHQQKENTIQLLGKDNRIKDEELKTAAVLRKEKETQLQLLDGENKIKSAKLERKDLTRDVLIAGLAAFLIVAFVVFRVLILKKRNEKLRRLQLENEMKIQQLQNLAGEAELQRHAAELEMKALKAQMNPHFIFNCLSSINCYILENDSASASDYLTRFSRLIRMVLNNSQKASVTLDDELKMLELYLDMERLRFEKAFDYSIITAPSVAKEHILVPPLLLQPFCENSIWHGLMHKDGDKHLRIEIKTEGDLLKFAISDNGIGVNRANSLNQVGKHHNSMGLKLSADRLALLNNGKQQSFYKINDIVDEKGNVCGTKVTLQLKLQTADYEMQ